jgi:cyclase
MSRYCPNPGRTHAAWLSGAALALLASVADAQALRTTHVAGSIYVITGAGGNVTVSVGASGVMIVDSGSGESSEALLAAVREIADGPIRYVINTSVLPEHVGGNSTLRGAGATFTGGNATVVGGVDVGAAIVGHEQALLRMAAEELLPTDGQPTETFYVQRYDLYFNGEPVELIHQPAAVDDTNLIVHFRRSDVISTGDVFRLDSYPVIDLEHGGSIEGVIDSLNRLVELAVSDTLAEGGTLLIPGHGRICDEADLVRYRDMVTIVRDRIRALIERGMTLEQIKAQRPTLDYDSRYGRGSWSGDDFIEAVFRSSST